MYPADLKYYTEHTWLKAEGNNRGRVGITYYAQDLLKELVYIELPGTGTQVSPTEPFGVIESRKATFDIYSPVSGVVTEVNHSVEAEPGIVNRDPYGKGWMIVVEFDDPAQVSSLMSAEEYCELILNK
jgi:glycine cleavage system H protein